MDCKDISIKTELNLSDEEIIKRIKEKVEHDDIEIVTSGYDSSPIFTVKELADKLNVSVHTIRYYDNEHLFPFVKRTESNGRLFSMADYAYGKMILCLRDLGLSIHDCRLFILDTMEGDETINERLRMLLALEKQLEAQIKEINHSLRDLQFKIRYYSYIDDVVVKEKENDNFKNLHRGSLKNLHEFVLRQRSFEEND